MASLRILPENDPIRVPEVQQDNAGGVSGMVIDCFKQGSKKIKLFLILRFHNDYCCCFCISKEVAQKFVYI